MDGVALNCKSMPIRPCIASAYNASFDAEAREQREYGPELGQVIDDPSSHPGSLLCILNSLFWIISGSRHPKDDLALGLSMHPGHCKLQEPKHGLL
jgi:hypothetical protein